VTDSAPLPERLYPLLPAVYRITDHDLGEPLRALLGVLEEPYRAVEDDIRALYDDWFVETCAPWLVPYVGDLVGVRDTLDPNGVIPTVRARVANALAYAHRKGPAWVLAHAARDVTGWPARAVEYFQLLGQTQDVGDVRPLLGRTADLRFGAAVESGTPFDAMARTVEVRGADSNGRWAADRVGLFLWRLRSYPLTLSQPCAVRQRPGCFTLCPFGADTPLFLPPRTQVPFGHEPEPWDVPGPVGPELMVRVLEERGRPGDPWEAGEYPVLRLWAGDGRASALECVLTVADLESWSVAGLGDADAARNLVPRAAVDPRRGRIAFLGGARPAWVRAEWSYGFAAELGGGPYARGAAPVAPGPDAFTAVVGDARLRAPGEVAAASVAEALDMWMAGSAADGVVRLADSAIHPSPAGVVSVPPGRRLWIVAGAGQRPCLAGDLNLEGIIRSGVMLDGLLVDGTVRLSGSLDLFARHCTLSPPVPGAAGDPRRAVSAQTGYTGSVSIGLSVLGPLSVPWDAGGVSVADCIVAGGVYAYAWGSSDAEAGPGAPLHAERCTVLGMVRAQSLAAGDCIFVDPVLVDDVTAGGLTCCYAPLVARSPRRDRCQPVHGAPAMQPLFTSTRYGDPAFAQLDVYCASAIRQGAGNGGEMGAFHALDVPRRESNLRAALNDYLPNGLEAAISFVT
jgi:hypothetical protein